MIETEIKFIVKDLTSYRTRLLGMNAVKKASFFEDNIIFDDEKRSLTREGKLLRLRKCDTITITFKAPVEKSRFKIMEEHEIEVSDFETAYRIIASLGYKKIFRYQKNREIYDLKEGKICFDQTPIGNIIEIEGSQDYITKLSQALNLKIEEGTAKNYMELYEEYCRKNKIKPADMVFHP